MKRLLVILISGLLVSGCAGQNLPEPVSGYQSTQGDSLALSVMKAVDLADNLRDADPARGAVVEGARHNAVIAGLGGASFALSTGSALAGAGWGVVDILTANHVPPVGTHSVVIGWVPKSFAADEVAARNAVLEILGGAVARAAEAVRVDGYEFGGVTHKDLGGARRRITAHFRGGDCDAQQEIRCGYVLSSVVPAMPIAAPDFLGGGPSFLFRMALPPSFVKESAFGEKIRPVFPDLDILQRASADLPPWLFIYGAPKKFAARKGDQMELIPNPFVLQSGNVHLFVKPPGGT